MEIIQLSSSLENLLESELYSFKGGLVGGQSETLIEEVIITVPADSSDNDDTSDGNTGYDWSDYGDEDGIPDYDGEYFPPDGGIADIDDIDDPGDILTDLRDDYSKNIAALKDEKLLEMLSEDDKLDAKEVLKQYERTLETLNMMDKSQYKFKVEQTVSNGDSRIDGSFTYDSHNKQFVISVETGDLNNSVLAHELEHVRQFLEGRLTLDSEDNITGYSMQDEIDAYNVQHKIEKGVFYDEFDLTGDKVSNGDYIITADEIKKEFPGIYDNLN